MSKNLSEVSQEKLPLAVIWENQNLEVAGEVQDHVGMTITIEERIALVSMKDAIQVVHVLDQDLTIEKRNLRLVEGLHLPDATLIITWAAILPEIEGVEVPIVEAEKGKTRDHLLMTLTVKESNS